MATRKASKQPAPMLNIGASKETVTEAKGAILAILGAPHADEATKQAALNALHEICAVRGASISNCSFTSG